METAAGRRANGPLGPTWNLILFSLKFTHCPLPDYLDQKIFKNFLEQWVQIFGEFKLSDSFVFSVKNG